MAKSVTNKVRQEVYQRDDWTCIWCNIQYLDPNSLTIAHYKTKGSGGANTPQNLVTLCPVCHEKQHHDIRYKKPIEEYMGIYLKRIYGE